MKNIINILTIFPEPVKSYIEYGMVARAVEKEKVAFNIIDIRDFSEDKHRKVDDVPYGGGPGMVMKVDIIARALESLENPGVKILLSPGGEDFNQDMANDLAGENMTLICGRYMGIDYRIREFVDRVISTGNYIVSGGELPALIISEAVTRLIPGVLGDKRSIKEDRGYPIYTRPREYRGLKVPEVLLSGNHKKIEEYREQEAGYGENDR